MPEERTESASAENPREMAAENTADNAAGNTTDHAAGAAERTADGGPWSRLGQALIHPGRTQLLVGALLCVLTFAVIVQIRSNREDSSYTTARRADLVQMIDGLGQESRRLEAEIVELDQARQALESGADFQQIAREEAQKRMEALSILAGTAPAQGTGVRITVTDPENKVGQGTLLDAIEEMRDAGAEAMEINDSHRIVASSYVGGAPGALTLDGRPIGTPLVLDVIGDPHALAEAARFRGGLVSEVTAPAVGGSVSIEQPAVVEVSSLHAPPPHEYARPTG